MRLARLVALLGAALLCAMVALTPPAHGKRINGSGGPDRLIGTQKGDVIKGRGDDDRLAGRGRRDKLRGGAGDDTLRGGRGRDVMRAGKGADLINAADERRDRRVDGGAGDDTCRIDLADLARVLRCEALEVPGGGEVPDGGLGLTTATGLGCASALPTCPFEIHGTGADALLGTVEAGGDVSLALGAAVAIVGEDWTATGLYGCTGPGFLRVTIGAEAIDVPISCAAA